VIVETAKGCIGALMAGVEMDMPIDILFLDHDLGGTIMQKSGPGTGYEVAQWLEQHSKYQPRYIVIHSFNPDGAMRMNAALPKAMRIPGAWDFDIELVLKVVRQYEKEAKAKEAKLPDVQATQDARGKSMETKGTRHPQKSRKGDA
jgi:hypothetical protein